MHNVPFSKEDVDYNHIYSFNVANVPVLEIFTEYFNNRGGRWDAVEKHIKKIRDAIVVAGNMDKFPAITVDINTNQIADGNCRFKAIKSIVEEGLMNLENLNLRVIYEDIPEDEFDNRVIQLNIGQQSWSLTDFIYNYSNRGFDSFTRLIEFCMNDETLHSGDKINPRYGGAALKITKDGLMNPSLVITDEDVERGKKTANEAAEIRVTFSKDRKANGGGWYEPYLRAWAEFRDTLNGITFKDYLKEVKQTVERRKREVQVPYGSNKKADWNAFFRTVKTYVQ